MTEINNFDALRSIAFQPQKQNNQKYFTQSYQQKSDTVELSTKQNETPKKGFKKYLLAGLAVLGTGLAVALGLKHLNAKKVRELEEKAREEAERLRQQAEEAQRAAEEKAREEARIAQEKAAEEARKAQELAEEEARKAKEIEEKAAQETKITEEPVKTEPENTAVETEIKVEEPKTEISNEPKAEEKPEVEPPKTKEVTEEIKQEPAKPETITEKPETKVETKEPVKEEPAVSEKEPVEEIKTGAPKIRPVRPEGLSKAMNTALDFGEDLTDLVNGKNATPEEIQKLVQKHFNNDNIRIHGMSEYDGMGVNAKNKAATTRPFFNEDGKLETIDIFVPDLDYNNPNAVMEFISKTTHEMTHVAQFIEKDCSNAEHLKPTMEGRCLNYIQKIITDRYTDKLPTDMIKELFREKGIIPKSAEDVNKFFDTANPELTLEKIGEVTKLGTDEFSRKQNVNIIFDVLFDPMMEQMAPRDINVQSLMEKHGGYEGFKAEMKRICAETFRNEQEAYKAEEMMRQELCGNVGQDTNYGIIHKIMGICADALG